MLDISSYTKTLSYIPLPSLLLQADGDNFTIAFANDAYLQLLHTKEKNILYKPLFTTPNFGLSDINEQIAKTLIQLLQTAISSKQQQTIKEQSFTIYHVSKNKISHHYITFEIVPIDNKDGAINLVILTLADVTAQALAQQQVLQLQQQLHLCEKDITEIEDRLLIGRWEIDLERKKITWSDEVFIICGYEPQAFDPSERQQFSITHPDDATIAKQALEEAITNGTPFSIERRLIKANGDIAHVLSKGKAITDATGKIIKIRGFFQDITKQVQQTKDITTAKLYQEALINGTNDLIWLMDTQMHVLLANDAYHEKIKEFEENNKTHNNEALLLAKEERKLKWASLIPEVLKGNVVSFKETIFNPLRDAYEHAAVTITPIKNDIGEVETIACFAKDITLETANLSKLATTNNQLQNIMSASLDVICSLDGQANFLSVSAASAKVLGYAPEDMIGKSIVEFLHPDDVQATIDEAPKVRASGVLIHFENRYIHKNGSVVYLSWTGSYQPKTDILYCIGRDITEKKQIDDTLKASEKLYKNLFENNPSPMFIWDFETYKIIECNTEMLLLYGYEKAALLQQSLLMLIHEQDIEEAKNAFDLQNTNGHVTRHGVRHKKKNGDIVFVDITAHILDYHGRKCSLVLITDITEKLQAQKDIIVSEAKYRSFFENSLDAIIITTGKGEILDVNPAACTLFWRDKEEFKTLKREDIFDETDTRLAKFINERNAKGYAKAEVTYITKIGKKYQCELSSSRYKNTDGEYRNHIIIRDINKRKKAEMQLSESEAKYRSFFENSLDGVFITKSDGEILEANPAACKLFQMTLDELRAAGRNGTVDQTDTRLAQLLKERELFGKAKGEITHIRKDGTKFEAEVTTSAFTDAQGETVNALITRDITERQKTEEALKLSNERFMYATKATSDAIWDWDLNTGKIVWGDGFQYIFGYNLSEIEPTINFRILHIHPRDRDRVINGMNAVINSNITNWEDTYRFLKADNTYVQVINRGFVIRDKNGNAMRMVGAKRDISEYQYYTELEKLERNILAINEVGDKTLEEVLSIYLLGIEVLHPAMICSILQLQGNQLFNLASPSLPEAYIKAINGVIIGNNVGSCGTAAFTKQNVIVDDIQTDIRWANYKDLAAEFGLRACWSNPIQNQKEDVIATFATYYQTKKIPTALEQNTVTRASNILKIILESYARTQALRESNERYHLASKATSDAIWDWDLITGHIVWGEGWQTIFGFDIDTINKDISFKLYNTHPDDLEKLKSSYYNIVKSSNNNWEEEYQIKKANGEYAYVVSKGFVIRDKAGKAIRMVGATRDVTKKKQEELRLQLLESVITNTNDSVIITEADSLDEPGPRIVYVNEAFTKMTGYTAEEVIGETPRLLQGAKTDEKELKKLKNALQKWESYEATLINYRKDGTEFWVNFLVSPVADEKGWFTHWVSIQRDITEKVLEEQNLTKAIIKAQENERYEIGGELHDNVCQILTSSQLSLKMLKKALGPAELIWYDKGIEAIILASREIRNLSHRLAPSFFNDTTLELAITTLIHTFNIDQKYQLHILFDSAFKNIPTKQEIQINLYRIVQEQLKNIFKYAEASVIEVIGTVKNDKLFLEIIDNGIGFNVNNVINGIGIANMKRRTELFLGKFEIQSELGKGCKVLISIPLEEVY